jgi:1-acyl-sn-glycerol-3-phosphate acyltransferase
MERIKEIKSSVIVANHPSLIDIIILVCLIPKPLCVVKSSLTDNIFMKNIVSSVYILNNTDIDIFISECTRALNSGYNIIIFPEGTRTIYGKSKKYHRGAAYIALKSNASVIPVHIDMSDHILGKDKKFYDVSDRPVLYTLTVKSPIIMSETVDKNLLDSANARNIMAKIQLLLSS